MPYKELLDKGHLKIDIKHHQAVHMVGIGGAGMSGLALNLMKMGKTVSGSDITENENVKNLRSAGILIYIGHNAGNIPSAIDLIVRSAAIKPDNPELTSGLLRDIPILKYSEMLGILMGLKTGIAVAGTHGKTTTTSMLAHILETAGMDPSFIVGGLSPNFNNMGYKIGNGQYFIAEACEYDRSFHNLIMQHALINNIEEDHLDYYKDLDEIIASFHYFATKVPKEGFLFYAKHSKNTGQFVHELKCNTVSYSIDNTADFTARDIVYIGSKTTFVVDDHHTSIPIELHITGKHNVINSLASFACSKTIGVDYSDIQHALLTFKTPKRRFEVIYKNDIIIIDDYAHHPTEIESVLKSIKQIHEDKKLIAIFQPHQHSRTRFLLNDFARSLGYADVVILPDIYFVRDNEEETKLIHARSLIELLDKSGVSSVYIPSFEEILAHLKKIIKGNEVVITMGAGDIYKIAYSLKSFLEGK